MQTNSKRTVEIVEAEIVAPKPALLERLLSPRSLQIMMASGGGLLVVGFAVWLWSIGVFENPLVLATSVGAVNLGLLTLGVWLSNFDRFRLAGRGLTLLSSLLLPLNLWLYDSQGLISLNEGGPLWIPALLCCVIYGLTARITKDSMFVYTLVGGIALTGTLFLAGAPGNLFWSVIPLAVFLVSLGGVCIYADSWFLDTKSEFTRDKFGKAFFVAGHAVLLAGITLVAGGLFGDFLSDTVANIFETPQAMKAFSGKFWVLGVLIWSAIAYFYSNRTRRSHVAFEMMGILMAACAVVQTLVVFEVRITLDGGLVFLMLAMIATNLIRRFLYRVDRLNDGFGIGASLVSLSLIAYVFIQYALNIEFFFAGWVNVAQAVLVAGMIYTLPGIWGEKNREAAAPMLYAASVCLAFAAAVAAIGFGFTQIAFVAAFFALIVLAISIVNLFIPGDFPGMFAIAASNVVAFFWISSIVATGVEFTALVSLSITALTAISCGLLAYDNMNRIAAAYSVASALVLMAQIVVLFNLVNGYAIVIAVMVGGIALIVAARTMGSSVSNSDFFKSIHVVGNSLVCVAAAGAALFGFSALATGTAVFAHVGLILLQLVAIGIAAGMTDDKGWRRGFMVAAIATLGSAIALIAGLSTLTFFQRVEIFSIGLGTLMVVMGYIGWSREKAGQKSDVVSFNLITGSWILVAPFIIGIISDRMADGTIDMFRYVHEIGGLVAALALLGSGILCQIRSTTVSGATLLTVFVVSNILLINIPDQLQQTSVLMMIGGAVFFVTAILLSIYRETLVALPKKFREGSGVFQVMKWR